MALRAKLYFERHIIFEISRSEISKMMCLSKQSSAAEVGKRFIKARKILLLKAIACKQMRFLQRLHFPKYLFRSQFYTYPRHQTRNQDGFE